MRLPRPSAPALAAGLILAAVPSPAAAAPTRTSTTVAGTAPVRLAERARLLAITWHGARAGAAIRLRRAGRWTAWRPLRPGDAAARGDQPGNRRASRFRGRRRRR